MGLSKKLKKIGKAVVNPVGAGIEKLTGLKQGDQFKIGAGIGGLVLAGRGLGMFGSRSGIPGLQGGVPLTDGVVGSSSQGAGAGFLGNFGPSMLGIAGDIYSARTLAGGQESANAANLQSAREQMAFQERMSSTSHQREVEDLKAAGLNPVLSANSGASTPVGASPDIANQAPNYTGTVGRALGTALQIKQMQKDFEGADSVIAMNKGALDVQRANAEASTASAVESRNRAKMYDAQYYEQAKTNEWIQNNPKAFNAKKYGEVIAPYMSAAKDLAVSYGAAKFGKAQPKFGGNDPDRYYREKYSKEKP